MYVFENRFAGKTMLITGGTSGIGKAACLRAAAEGAFVVVVGRNAERGQAVVDEISALGILETYDAASIIEAADQAAKTAIVDLIELRIAKGMCGKSYMLITGEVSAVEASIQRAKELVAEKGMYLDSSVIAHPDKRMIDTIL